MEKLYQDKDWLEEQYISLRLSQQQIAQICNCSDITISRALRRFKIRSRSYIDAGKNHFGNKKYYQKEWLYKHYILKKQSIREIAKKCNCDHKVISHWLNYFQLPLRSKIAWNKGLTKETNDIVLKLVNLKIGKPRSEETKRKIALAHIGKRRIFSKEHRKHLSEAQKGSKHWNWKGGLSSKRNHFYTSREWKHVWNVVYKRDNGICQCCKRKTIISINQHSPLFPNIHHIIGFECEQTRLILSNLILVCKECHLWIHSKANKEKEFILESTQENIKKIIKIQKTGTLLEYIYL